MDSNYGLLSGLGQGLKEGFNSFIENSRYQDEQARKKKDDVIANALKNLQLKQAGYQIGDDGQTLVPTEQGEQEQQLKSSQTAKQLAEADPNSEESKSARDYYKGLISSSNPKVDINKIIPETMSAAALKDKSALLPDYLKGVFSVQGREATSQRVGESNDIKRGFLEARKQSLGLQQNKIAGQVQEQIMSDPIIKQYSQTANQGARALSLFKRPDMTYQELNDAMMEYGKAISGSGALTDSKLERTEFSTAQGKLANFAQYLSGEPQNAVPPAIKARAMELITDLNSTVQNQIANRAETKRKLFTAPGLNAAQDYAINKFKTAPIVEENSGLLPTKPKQVSDEDWKALSPAGKKALADKLNGR